MGEKDAKMWVKEKVSFSFQIQTFKNRDCDRNFYDAIFSFSSILLSNGSHGNQMAVDPTNFLIE